MSKIRDTVKRKYDLNGIINGTLASVMNSVTLSNIRVTKYGMIYEILASVLNPRHCQMYIPPNKEYFQNLLVWGSLRLVPIYHSSG